jgi:pre-mRNA-splicing factor ISY1
LYRYAAVRRTRHQMNKNIDADYYGFRDEEDGILLKEEEEAEKALVAAAVLDWVGLYKLEPS